VQPQCDMRDSLGARCTARATHHWGITHSCCRHYDRITSLLIDLSQAVAERRHAELLALYEKYSRQIAKLCGEFEDNPENHT
jgi:hypothetical protein